MSFILSLLLKNKLKIALFLCASVATSLLGVGVLAFINGSLLKGNAESSSIWLFSFLLIIFFLSSNAVEISLSIFGQNFIFSMQKRVIKQILDTSFLQIDKIGKARLLASLGSDVRTISFGLLRLPDCLQSSILIIATSCYLAYLSLGLFLLCALFLLLILLVNHQLIKRDYAYFKRARDDDDALQHNYQNIIDGRKELALNTFRAKFYYEKEFKVNAANKRHHLLMSNILSTISSNWTNISLLALVGLEFYFAKIFNLASIEDATTIALAILFLRTSLMAMIGSIPTLLMAKVALDKIENLQLSAHKEDFIIVSSNEPRRASWRKISFKNVAFSYNQKFSLTPTNLAINKGEIVFLIGKNGSGKSTFCLLLAGLIKSDSGGIFLDDMQINDDNLPLYRSLITAIFSDFHLFTQALSEEDFASEEDIAYWLSTLELDNKIIMQDKQILTTKLSTGQKKRLAMLIGLLEGRDVLILDEWAADQDPLFRKFFYKKLLPLLKQKGKTIIAISHDDRYFDVADRIFLAQNGAIKELKGEDIKEIAKNAVERF